MVMEIDLVKVPTLWYEDKDGKRYLLSQAEMERCADPPPGFIYQNSSFPTQLNLTVLKMVQADEVAACDHPEEDVHKTYGWIEGTYGRECKRCHGTQLRQQGEPWPEAWEAHGSRQIMGGSSGWSEDLVLAMARPRWFGWLRGRKRYKLSDAILIAANSCERCTNVLGDRYGLKWGYAEGSEEWERCGTSCQFCED